MGKTFVSVGERRLEGPATADETTERIRVIQERLKAAQSRQKSYADSKRRPLKFEVGDFVFLKASPMKGKKRFGKAGKLQPRYVGPFEVLNKVGEVSYRLVLPPELSYVHDVFHVSMLRRHLPNSDEKLLVTTPTELQGDLRYEVTLEKIIGRKDKVLRNKVIQLVKVWWTNQREFLSLKNYEIFTESSSLSFLSMEAWVVRKAEVLIRLISALAQKGHGETINKPKGKLHDIYDVRGTTPKIAFAGGFFTGGNKTVGKESYYRR
ncbi:uncharacterized protein LOC131306805 [Rhododendron vialii]|uniref:uncharacterized protein LOC131306805 n=1 Tax=Rhododendron vialii TaxID=182163 RepID=UPI00265F5510|nr:uncharacterized protein LOC131306805 [Rhododendron vialii]